MISLRRERFAHVRSICVAARPVIIARMRLLNPARQTITTWTSRKSTRASGDEEMNRARGLLAAEHSDGRRNRGNKGGRHRQARPDDQREQNEDHEQVGEPLEHVIRPGFCLTRPLEAQMVGDCARERPPRKIGLTREQVFPEMPCKQAEDYIQQAGQYQQPRQLESGDTGSSRSGPAARSRSRSAPMPSRQGSAV